MSKKKPWCRLVFVCPNCFQATALTQPVPAIQYGLSRLPKMAKKKAGPRGIKSL